MFNFKRKRRAYLMPILKMLRRVFNAFKKYAYPNYKLSPTVYDMYKEDQIKNCYEHFKKYFKTAVLLNSENIRVHAINLANENDKDPKNYYLEFGVFSGTSINFFSQKINKNIYGFDSFEGLKEDWLGTSVIKGTFDLKKQIPKLNSNVIPISGWVQDTLPKFLDEKKPKINFVHMDIDTYESSKFVLENIKPFLIKGAIILFDELYNFEGWDVGEYKALTEVFDEKDYGFVSFSTDTSQAAIKILN